MTDFDNQSDRSALRESMTGEEWAALKAAEPGGGGGPNSKYFGGAKKPDFHLLGTDLFGEEIKQDATGKIREKFEFPPFTVLNAREGPWQERKRAWLACGIQSEVGRGENLLKMSDTLLEPDPEKRAEMQAARHSTPTDIRDNMAFRITPSAYQDKHREEDGWQKTGLTFASGSPRRDEVSLKLQETSSGTSIFDPVLTELCYRWFCPPGGMIVDPFAGGSVRGIVAGLLGFQYHGIDLRPEQIEANEAQRALICPDAPINWVVGDSNEKLKDAPDADFIFSCPPYGDLEEYSDDPNDLSAMTWEKFVGMYRSIIRRSVERLKPDRFACFVIGEYRDKQTGLYRGFVPLTCASFMAAGASLYNEAILITAVGSLPIRVTKQFETSRKLGKTHQNVIICVKGDPKIAAEAINNTSGDAHAPSNKTSIAVKRPHIADSKAFLADATPAPAATDALAFAFTPKTTLSITTPEVLPHVPAHEEGPERLQEEVSTDIIRTEREGSIPSPAPHISFSEPTPKVSSLAAFLGTQQPKVDLTWKAQEPPSLDGIDDIILNFATDGLDWARGSKPVGVTVSTIDGKMTRFLPFAFAGSNLDEETVKRWAERELRGKKITNAKTKFDLHMSNAWGIDLEAQGCTFSDIQHTAALLDDHRKRFNIDLLAADYLPILKIVPRVDESRHATYHASEVAKREIFTAQLVGRLRDVMYPQIDLQELRAVQELEDAVIPCVVEMERNGSLIDMELLEQFQREYLVEYERLMYEISYEAGFAFDHTASGWKRLLEHLALEVPDSFAEAELNEIKHPLIQKGQRAAQYASLNSKIFKAYPEHIIDGILRYDIHQLASDEGGTVSGRFSIGLVQQVPNHDNHHTAFGEDRTEVGIKNCGGRCALFPRRLFIPKVGDYLEADAAQIEFRLLVHYSENAKLLQAYADDPKMSFHKQMQKMLQVYKPDMLYAHTKNYNFAAQYGARSIKLAVMMGFITAKDGEEIRSAKRWNDPRLNLIHEIEAAYKNAHPEAGELLDRASHLAKVECDKFCHKGDKLHRQFPHRGFVKTLLGRRSRFPTNYKTYIGLNRVLQGGGAELMKMKLVELHKERKETGFVMRITNHDAALGDATQPDTLEKVSAILNRQSYPTKVPILWECGVGRTWAEAK